MDSLRRKRRRGLTAVELTAVCAVVGLLLTMGFMLYRSMRLAARVSVAESNLKQVATGMELYFRKFNSYPPQGSDLTVELAPFVENPSVFENPLLEEEVPGETINDMYREPTLEEIDSPYNYITSMVADNGTTVVVLKTGNKIDRRDDLTYDPDNPEDLLAVLDPGEEPGGDDIPGDGEPPDDPPDPPDDPENNATPDDYTEESPEGIVTPKDCFDATFEVLAAQLTWGDDGPEVPITVAATYLGGEGAESTVHGLFGGEDVDGGESETRILRDGQSYTLTAHAEYGTWSATYSSDGDVQQVLTVRNGDQPEVFDPYGSPLAVGPALEGLIDASTGTVTIEDNQILYLFELGTESTASEHYDLQDLIVLVTLTEPANPAECVDAEDGEEGFDVDDDGDVTVTMCSDVTIKCIGSQFGYADGTLVDIGAAAKMGSAAWFDLYGGQPVSGGEEFEQTSVDPGTTVTLKGEIIGPYERWLWSYYGYPLSYVSNDGTGQVLVYKTGNQPPDFQPGFPCQASAGELVAPYIDPQTGVVTIADNEALYLWDFNPIWAGYGIDFQDLIILATAEAAETECEGDDTSTPMAYVAVRDSDSAIKFENAPVGLGEGGAQATDRFVIEVADGGNSVQVTTKASPVTATTTLTGVGDSVVDSLGFRITLESIDGGTYTLSVTSVSNEHALSYVEFDFGSGQVQTSGGAYTATRTDN